MLLDRFVLNYFSDDGLLAGGLGLIVSFAGIEMAKVH